jgi:putative transposase
MPRQARIDAPGALHHIICRGLERREIFRYDADREDFIARLGTVLAETSTRCFAWALIPNHFHLLLQTGETPLATVMRRLLTGYGVSFNRRHKRHGHLFQNRYKSILCQGETYLLELVRYIHLNPLRAGLVSSLEGLEKYRFCGHSRLMGRYRENWQDTDAVLIRFGKRVGSARKEYAAFLAAGVAQGHRPDLIGGGLIRSAGGWQSVTAMRQTGLHLKSDERILGDSDFVESVLQGANERFIIESACREKGLDLEGIAQIVGRVLDLDVTDLWRSGKQPARVQARNLFCYWAVRELGLTATELAGKLNMSQPSVSRAVQRGERVAQENGWRLIDLMNA